MILAGDIGGTKTWLALGDHCAGGTPAIAFEKRYASQDYGDFSSLLGEFMRDSGATRCIARACLGVAGPVLGTRAKVTYLPWQLDTAELAQQFGIARLSLVNDFAAAARGIETLTSNDCVNLQEGLPEPHGTRVVIGAGTGLGVAALVWLDGAWRVVSGEGGHLGFAPADDEQLALTRFLRERIGRVSAERVLSGRGLADIYCFLSARQGKSDMPDPLQATDPAAAIGSHALSAPTSMAAGAVDLFVRAYGAFAGDLALLFMARGGIYLAGGIAPKILPRLKQGGFLEAFRGKGAHHALMPQFPVWVVTNEMLCLLGAARIAAEL
jgi:glucokinase